MYLYYFQILFATKNPIKLEKLERWNASCSQGQAGNCQKSQDLAIVHPRRASV